MKTIYVEPKDIQLGDKNLGTVKSITINGSASLYAEKVSVWVNMSGDNGPLSSKTLEVSVPSTGLVWDNVEADVLEQLGLEKSEDQTPPSAPLTTPAIG